ncbi:DUF2637 domain-containing protein [Streptomyces sp. NBC_00162]|uniref:DUF2637 domain-containing protein n=1 Tax=Streptomyces sp. NBC_00162 TaxID=2903629 RepID=UPI00214C64AD|nr:DUF2637 domain-containing protein [Streptomyces sp. NBC_00162]UUU37570.1 DUF2637 domain-containing protein [Streptomyces sp. NBC_00162]
MTRLQLTRTHRILIGVVVAGAVVIAGIGFAGSYSAVRALALQKGFGSFSLVFPIGIDAGICVLLALDLLLTWIRIPFPLLRQTAWLLTIATIAFNGAAAWPDPLGVGMHAVIPILFVVTVEAARHAVGRIADITADRHMEGVRLTRWLLSPVPTFKLWRRMKLWELRSYEQAVGMEQDRLIYQARLQARYGRSWRRKAPVEALMPLKLARIGVPLSQTAPEGLAAAGIDPALLPPAPDTADHLTVERADTPQAVSLAAHGPVGEPAVADPSARGGGLTHALEPAADQDWSGRAHPYGPEYESTTSRPQPTAPRAQSAHMTEMELWKAYRSYAARIGEFPDATVFVAHLAEAYGVVDPMSGAPLPTTEVEELLTGFPGVRTVRTADDSVTGHGTGDGPHPFFEPAAARSDVRAPAVDPASGQVPAPSAAPDDRLSTVGSHQQTSLDALTDPASARVGEAGNWEATVTDTGAAAARLPQQQTEEPDLDPLQQQILTVAAWLAEAEETGAKLSGAEVARRLKVSPKTGQRRVIDAVKHLAEQRRQQGRTHLRSV